MVFFKRSPYKPLFDKNKKRVSASELRDILDPNTTPILLPIGHSEWVTPTLTRRQRFLSAVKYIAFLCKRLLDLFINSS